MTNPKIDGRKGNNRERERERERERRSMTEKKRRSKLAGSVNYT